MLVLRDATESERSGLYIPDQGREKPHAGIIHAVGSLVEDKYIKAGKGEKCLFHVGVGFELDYEEVIYLVLTEDQIIAMP